MLSDWKDSFVLVVLTTFIANLGCLPLPERTIPFIEVRNLTSDQKDGVMTMEFNDINLPSQNGTNQTYMDEFYRIECQAIVDALNRNRKNISLTTGQSSTEATTVAKATQATTVSATTTEPTTVATTTTEPTTVTTTSESITTTTTKPTTTIAASTPEPAVPVEKRRKRNVKADDSVEYVNDDVKFVEIKPDIKDEVLRTSVFVEKPGVDTPTERLEDAIKYLHGTDKLGLEIPITKYYRGLPDDEPVAAASASAFADYRFWLPLLLAILILLFCLICIFMWKKKQMKDDKASGDGPLLAKEEPTRSEKAPPTNTISPSPNGHMKSPPDFDDCGWIVPMDQFSDSVLCNSPSSTLIETTRSV